MFAFVTDMIWVNVFDFDVKVWTIDVLKLKFATKKFHTTCEKDMYFIDILNIEEIIHIWCEYYPESG